MLHPWCFLYLATAIAPLAFHTLRVSPVEYLQLWGRFFNGITLPEARPMDVETDWLGAIKQSLEGIIARSHKQNKTKTNKLQIMTSQQSGCGATRKSSRTASQITSAKLTALLVDNRTARRKPSSRRDPVVADKNHPNCSYPCNFTGRLNKYNLFAFPIFSQKSHCPNRHLLRELKIADS